MPISPGTRLGPYEITAKLGEGGMGEVYRATDTELVEGDDLSDVIAHEAGPEGPASIGNVPTMTSPALTADGKCLAFPRSSSAPPRLAILQNFFEELRAKVPVK